MSKMTTAIAALGVVAGLGVAAMPLATYADTTRDVPLKLTVEETIEISTSSDDDPFTKVSDVELSTANKGDNADYASKDFEVFVKTNASNGYTISAKSTTTETALKTADGNEIPANAALAAGTSAWAYKVTPGTQGDGATAPGETNMSAWTAISATDAVIYTATQDKGGISTANKGLGTGVTFGASISNSQAAGDYTGSVTFTAAAGVATPETPTP